MSSRRRTQPLFIALAAGFLAAASWPVAAQSKLAQTDTPNFVENWSQAPAAPAPAEAAVPVAEAEQIAEAATPPPVPVVPRLPVPEPPPISVTPEKPEPGVVENEIVDDTEPPKGKVKVKGVVIDQYPQNPRCYVAGRYVPAPPLCPN